MIKNLQAHLIGQIKLNGPMTMAQYIAQCLYNEQFGYYRTRNPIGALGDFVTAPEISQIFGELVAIWILDIWQRCDQDGPLHLIEFGPGQGTMMADILRTLPPAVAAITNVHLVDVNPVLIQVQQQKLNFNNVAWYHDLTAPLAAIKGGTTIILANELFDALPIHQLIKTNSGWHERYVTIDGNDELKFETGCLSNDIELLAPDIPAGPEGSIYEICPAAAEIIALMSQFLERQNGAALIIDYGTLQDVLGETLQATRLHAYHDILKDPGQADLTTHVNFAKLICQAGQFDVNIYGPNFQGTFLSELGIDIRAHALKIKANDFQSAEIDRAVHRLIDNYQMGELFKVLCLTSKNFPQPSGFATCPTTAYYSAA